MNDRPDQPPEGKLIAAALERSGLSIREASKRAGISYGRWRQITTGVQHVSPGEFAAVRAPAKTLAKMALTVAVTPEQMETEGHRPDAAEVMRQQSDSRIASPSLPPFNPPPVQRGTIFGDMSPEMAAQVRPLYEAVHGRVQVASAVRPGPLAGRHVFPDDEAAARQWDGIAARGLSIYPGQGFSPDEIAQAMAVAWYLDPARQAGAGDTAAGLAPPGVTSQARYALE